MIKLLSFFVFVFVNFGTSLADESIFLIENNQIYLENDRNVLELRKKARNISFQNAFNLLTKRILEPNDLRKLNKISEMSVEDLVKDYKIQEEKITEINYFSDMSVNFNSEKIRDLFSKNDIKINFFISESYLVFPIFKKFNTFYLWEDDNYWYDHLKNEYDNVGLLKLFFPEKNHINKLKISANQIIDEDIEAIKKFLDDYGKKKAIVIYFEESYNYNLNEFETMVNLKVFTDDVISKINLIKNDAFPKKSSVSQIELIAKISMNELQDWWKKKIESLESTADIINTFFLVLNSDDLRRSIFIENKIRSILDTDDIFVHELTSNNLIYKIFTKYSVDQINLALETNNLRLVKISEDDDHYLVDSY